MNEICTLPKWPALRALVILLLVAVCAQAMARPVGRPSTERAKYFCGRGQVISVDENLSGVTIRHEHIEGFMEAMTMHFKTEDAEVAKGIKPGDFVKFTLKDTSEKTRVVYIERILPPKRNNRNRKSQSARPA
jgi:Cu/Ag efflux protein CusF